MAGPVEIVEREFGELALNMGPQHPSTHGVLRLTLHLRGETVEKRVDTGCGVATPENMNEPEIAELLSPPFKKWLGEE